MGAQYLPVINEARSLAGMSPRPPPHAPRQDRPIGCALFPVSINFCGSSIVSKIFWLSGVVVPGLPVTATYRRRKVDRRLPRQRVDAALGGGIGRPALETVLLLSDMLTAAPPPRHRHLGHRGSMPRHTLVEVVVMTMVPVVLADPGRARRRTPARHC